MCLFSILCSAKPQTARTTTNSCHHAFQASRYWKVPCRSKPPCPALAVVGCFCAYAALCGVRQWRLGRDPTEQQAHPMHTRDTGRIGSTPDAAAPTAQLTHWCHTIRPPLEHLATSTRTSHTAYPLDVSSSTADCLQTKLSRKEP